MLTDAPDPLDFAGFQFRQLRKLCMNENEEKIPTEAINLVATSSRYGLVFVGIEGGFKVLKLEDIFDLNEDEEKRKEAKDFPCQKVASSTPCLLSLSADDMTLAVCVTRDSCAVADMYDIRVFADQEEMPLPFTSVRLSSDNNVKLRDLMWNPVVVEMYAFCLSDGSMFVHELAETNLKISANLPPHTNATAVCWSPKGKEVVVGKKNGTFSRFKPTLQEVKNFPPPAGLDENGVEVVSIFWISTTLFAVVYVPVGSSDDKTPSLVFVSTPKGADITYCNFGDVCYGSVCEREPRYMMHYDPEWKILVCVSSNAVETAIIGCSGDQSVWLQWMQDGTGRAEIPLVRDTEPSPLGMGIIYCAQRKIVISETECFPPMPVLFLLSTSGLLCPFHMLNTSAGATNLVYPSEPISREGERKRKDNSKLQLTLESQKPSSPLTSVGNSSLKIIQPHVESYPSDKNSKVIPSASSVPASSASVLPAQTLVGQNPPLDNIQVFSTQEINSFPFVQSQSNQKTSYKIGTSVIFDSSKPSAVSAPQPFVALKPFSAVPTSGTNPLLAQSVSAQVNSPGICSAEQSSKKFAAVALSPIQTVTQNNQLPLNSITADQKSALESIKAPESTWTTESTIVNAVLEEVAEFSRELQELKERSSKCDVLIGTKEEMSYLKKSSLSLVEFHAKMNFAIETLSSEVHSLKNMVLESYAMLSEAESQEKRLKDPKYVSMLRERSLDPRSAKQMQKIQQLNQYLSTQLSEVNDKLDNDWHEFEQQQQKNNRRKAHQLPSAEAIYRTIVSNQNIIYNQKAQLEGMIEALNRRKREGQTRGIKHFHNAKIEISDGELGKLADALLQTKINSNDGKIEVLHTPRKTIPLQKQAALRELLANRRVTAVKPTVIYNPSQSRLCSTLPVAPLASVNIKGTEKPPAIDVQKKNGKLENMELLSLQESVPETVPSCTTHQEVTSVPPFTARPPVLESKGGITQGIPMTKTLSKPTPCTVPTQAVGSGPVSIAFKTVQNGYSEPPPPPPSLLTKSSSQSAFTHLVPTASKPVPESPKLPSQSSAGKPSFTGQNLFQQKAVSSSNFVPMSNLRPGPERTFVPAFTFSETKEVVSVNNAFSSSPLCSSYAGHEVENIGSSIYEDISPPDSPHLTDEETETVLITTKLSEQNLSVKDTSETTVQPTCDEKLVTKPATDLKGASFLFSPVSEGKLGITSPASQKDVLQSHDGGVSSQPTVAKSPEITTASSPVIVSVSSSDNSWVASAIPVSQQFQNSSLSQSICGTPVTSVPSTLVSGLTPTTQVMVSSPTDSVVSPPSSVIPSSSSDNKEISCAATQAESPFASPKISASSTVSTLPPSSQPLQPNLGKVAAFTFALPAKDQNNQKEVKNLDTVTSSSTVPSNVTSTTTSGESSGDQSTVSSAEKAASSQRAIFGSVPSSTGSASSPAFAQLASVTSPLATASTTSAQSVFGQTSAVSSSASSGAFGLAATTPSSASSVFGQKTVTTATTTSVGTVATTTTTATSTLPFFGQQSASQSSFFGKTTLTSPVFGQAPQTQSSVFGQTVSSASSPSFGQTAAGSFFSQSPTTPGTSVFGQKAQSPSSSSAFGQSTGASGFSFQKASMEQQSTGSFGLTKSVFGQNPVFGQQQQNTSSPFGQSSPSSGGVFGQGGFFSGLGGKPSEENASKNVFASTISSPTASTGIFGNQGASSFGTKLGGSFSGGSFSSGSGTVAQSGFGAFQQTPQKTSGFGAPPSFGGSPSFGSSPNFGGSPTFGSGIGAGGTLGGSSFGSTPQAEGFGSFASSNSPTFGTLASQTGGFGGAAQQQQAPTFGSLTPQSPPSAFGGGGPVFGGSPGFGAQSNFGSPANSTPTQSSAFSQWRN